MLTTASSLRVASSGSAGVDEEEVRALPGVHFRHLTAIDPMRIDDDPALGRLPEHLGEPHHRHRAGGNDVAEHLPRPDRGQLVDIAYDQQCGLVRQGSQQGAHQQHVHHAAFVQHQQVTAQPVFLVAFEAAGFGIGLQQPMDRLGLQSGAVR